jgi:hypothetical protein
MDDRSVLRAQRVLLVHVDHARLEQAAPIRRRDSTPRELGCDEPPQLARTVGTRGRRVLRPAKHLISDLDELSRPRSVW